MKAVVDRIVQYANRYQLTNVETGEVLGTFDFEEVTGTVQQVGTEIDKELFDSIANDLAARVKLSGGELAETIVTFPDISGTAENVASGDTSATLWGKVKNWFSRLKALAFKNKVAAGDFEAGAIKNADVAADAAIAQSKVSGLMTDYVASISASGRTVTYKNKNGVNMGSITTQDTTYGLASQSSNGLMSSTDKTKLDGIESGAQRNTVLGVKGSSESAYRTGNVNITKANIGLGNVDNTSDEDKPVSTATQTALNGKANTSGTYPNLTVGKATNADNATNATNATNAANATKATQDASGNVITSTYATKNELTSGLSGKANTSGSYPNLTVGKATNADNATNATKAEQDADGNVIDTTYSKLSQVVRTDAAQSLTDAQKQQAQDNINVAVEKGNAQNQSIGWYQVAELKKWGTFEIVIAQSYNYVSPEEIHLSVNVGHTSDKNATITQLSGYVNNNFTPTKVRVRGNADYVYFDIYSPSTSFNLTRVTIKGYLNTNESVVTNDGFTYVGASDTADGYYIVSLDLKTGVATTGNYYANGSPVLVGSAPTWVTGTGGSLRMPSAGWYILGIGTPGTLGSTYSGITYIDGDSNLRLINCGSDDYIIGVIGLTIDTPTSNVAYYKLA